MDSDLAEAITALKEAFSKRQMSPAFGTAAEDVVNALASDLNLPRRYKWFLLHADPIDVETATPSERVRLVKAADLREEQKGFALDDAGQLLASASSNGWRPEWIIIGHSGLLGDPYFLDTSQADAEGDCPVFTAMSGTDNWKPRLCASSFALFLQVLAVTTEVAAGFSEDDFDPDNEHVFREAIGPRIREHDPAALKAGHWT